MIRRFQGSMGVYLVTGASKGIGRSLSCLLAEKGHQVILLARDSPELNEVEQFVKQSSRDSFSLPCDLASPAQIAESAGHLISSIEALDGLVHNAGSIHPVQPMMKADVSQWSRSIQVNLIGVQDLTQRLSSLLEGQQHCRVTTISSGASLRPVGSWSAYCTAKAGLDMWARCMAEEGKVHNISAISVAPGIVDTGMQEDIRAADPADFPSHEAFVSYHTDNHLTDPDDVATLLYPLITEHTMEQSGQRFDVRDL
jgi:benzil reductase ((S)-benzoin forming)